MYHHAYGVNELANILACFLFLLKKKNGSLFIFTFRLPTGPKHACTGVTVLWQVHAEQCPAPVAS